MSEQGHNSSGVIFDLDGTLIDTLDDISDAINAVFNEVGIDAVPRERVRSLVGEGLESLLSRASGEKNDERIADFVSRYRSIYSAGMLNKTQLYPGVDALLDKLSQKVIPMAVLSNKPHEYTAPIARALLGRWPFIDCRGAMDGVPRKPDPTAALDVAERMKRTVSHILFVGDSPTDIHTGRNAGMESVAVTWGYRDRAELVACEPTHIVDSPAELTDVLTHTTRS